MGHIVSVVRRWATTWPPLLTSTELDMTSRRRSHPGDDAGLVEDLIETPMGALAPGIH
jgi:hypothetical protein